MDCNSSSSVTPFSLAMPTSIFDGIKAMAGGTVKEISDFMQKINDIKLLQDTTSGIDSVKASVDTMKVDAEKIIADVNNLLTWLQSNPEPPVPPRPFDKTSQEYETLSAWATLFYPMLNGIIADQIELDSCCAGITGTAKSFLSNVVGCNPLNDATIGDITSNLDIIKGYTDAEFNQLLAIKKDFNTFVFGSDILSIFLREFLTLSTSSTPGIYPGGTAQTGFGAPINDILPLLDAISADLASTSKIVDASTPPVDTTAATAGVNNALSLAAIPAPSGLGATTSAALASTGAMPSVVNALKSPTDFTAIAVYGNTPDDQLVYAGTDFITWNRINNERIRRGLTGLSNPPAHL